MHDTTTRPATAAAAAAARPWQETLLDSVQALGAAARLWGRAAQDAAHAIRTYSTPHLHDGQVTVAGRATVSGRPVRTAPHGDAVHLLHRLAREHHDLVHREYRTAALAYAHGAAWATRTVIAGHRPTHVELPRDTERYWVLDRHRMPLEPAPELSRWAHAGQLRAAWQELLHCLLAEEAADHLAGRSCLSEREAAEVFELAPVARGLPAAAYTYGTLTESSVRYAVTVLAARAVESVPTIGDLL